MATQAVGAWPRAPRHTRKHRFSVLAGMVVPSLGVPILIFEVWTHHLGLSQNLEFVINMLLSYVISGFGITVGFHRLHTHKAFIAKPWLSRMLAVAGSMGLQGPIISWVADHRKHHKFSDKPGDPHSPHGHGDGWGAMLAGLWHAHTGWLFRKTDAPATVYAKDLLDDPFMVRISEKKWYFAIVILRLAVIPAFIGWRIVGDVDGLVYGIAWIGLVPAILLVELTFCINSVCHVFGKREFETEDESRNVFWLAPLTFGEAWHNTHHAFPYSYRHGIGHHLDLSADLIRVFEMLKWAKNVRRVPAPRVAEKLA